MRRLAMVAVLVAGCGGEGAPPLGVQPTLSSIQRSVFTPKCAGCHRDARDMPHKLSLVAGESWDQLVGKDSETFGGMPRVVPGEPHASALTAIAHSYHDMTAGDESAVWSWIEAGALDN